MTKRLLLCVPLAAGVLAASCSTVHTASGAPVPQETKSQPLEGMLAEWRGPYGGVPSFDRIVVADFKPAMLKGMDLKRVELQAIANNPNPATFENTIAALEDAGRPYARVSMLFGIYSTAMNSPEFQAVERELAPIQAAFEDEIAQNEKLFSRIEAVYNSPAKDSLTPEQQRLTWLYHTNFVLAGAKLGPAAKKRTAEINQALATLYTQFSQNVLGDEEHYTVTLETEADLAGLPQSVREGAAAMAKERGLAGKWVIANTRSSVEPFLTYSTREDLRKQVFLNFVNRGDNQGARNNNKLITQIVKLRAERAKLLGYPTFAHWRMVDTMAKTPERALKLMTSVWEPAVARVREEVADMEKIAQKPIEPWDYRFYAEKVRKAKYDLDDSEVKEYLQLEKLREGMFWVAGRLFGLSFTPVTDVSVYHPDVRVWEVKDKASKHIGLWYFDAYARTGKRSGAWMNQYQSQERFKTEVPTIVSNNANFVKGAPGEPVLVSWEDAVTLFHEFGHSLHGLASQVNYPTLSGTATTRDHVEFPSQLLERWLLTPEVLNQFAVSAKTGKPMPEALVSKIKKAATFNQGFKTVEYLSGALVDAKLHLSADTDIDPGVFEKQTLADLKMPKQVVMRHRTPQFLHVFSSEGYAAGYYSYLWSETLSADAFAAFVEAGGPYDQKVAERLRLHVFSAGNTVDPAEGYRAFRGRDPGVEALMRARGFPVPVKGKVTAATSAGSP